MKIRPLILEYQPKAASLLDHVFAPSKQEVQLFDRLHQSQRALLEWVCLLRNGVIAYIAFSQAYQQGRPIGWHLLLFAVQHQLQGQGIGTDLLRYALRQEPLNTNPIFVRGPARLFEQFGFTGCAHSVDSRVGGGGTVLSLRDALLEQEPIGYEPECIPHSPRKKKKKGRRA